METGSKEGGVGTISSENAEEVMANEDATRKTANEVEITMMIEICSFHEDMGEVQLITMTPEALAHMPKLVIATLEELASSGIELKRNSKNVSFEEVIDFYANPTMADFR